MYVELLAASPKFHSLFFQKIVFFYFSMGYNDEFDILEKNKSETQTINIPQRSVVRTVGRKIQDKLESLWLELVGVTF